MFSNGPQHSVALKSRQSFLFGYLCRFYRFTILDANKLCIPLLLPSANLYEIDHATASVSSPTVARILIEYDVFKPLLKRLWIGKKDTNFWQYIIFEKVPRYCATCKHLSHSDDTCYISKPELRNAACAVQLRKMLLLMLRVTSPRNLLRLNTSRKLITESRTR